MNPHLRYLRLVLAHLRFVQNRLMDVVDDVAARIDRIEDGENPEGVVTGLGPVLQEFVGDVRNLPPAELEGGG